MTKRRAEEMTGADEAALAPKLARETGAEPQYALPPETVRRVLEGGCLELSGVLIRSNSFRGLDLSGTDCARFHGVRFEDERAVRATAAAIEQMRPAALSISQVYEEASGDRGESLVRAALKYAADGQYPLRELTYAAYSSGTSSVPLNEMLSAIDSHAATVGLVDLWLHVDDDYALDEIFGILQETLVAFTFGSLANPNRGGLWPALGHAIADKDRVRRVASAIPAEFDATVGVFAEMGIHALDPAGGATEIDALVAIVKSASGPSLRLLRLVDLRHDAPVPHERALYPEEFSAFAFFLASSLLTDFEALRCSFSDDQKAKLISALRLVPTLRNVDLSGSGFSFADGLALVAKPGLASVSGLSVRIGPNAAFSSESDTGVVHGTLHQLATESMLSLAPEDRYAAPPFLRLRRWPALAR